MERTCWAFVDALESRYDKAGVLIYFISIIFIELQKYELQVFDGFLIHLKLLVHFADVLDESSEVELRLLDINMKSLREELEGIIVPRSQHFAKTEVVESLSSLVWCFDALVFKNQACFSLAKIYTFPLVSVEIDVSIGQDTSNLGEI